MLNGDFISVTKHISLVLRSRFLPTLKQCLIKKVSSQTQCTQKKISYDKSKMQVGLKATVSKKWWQH